MFSLRKTWVALLLTMAVPAGVLAAPFSFASALPSSIAEISSVTAEDDTDLLEFGVLQPFEESEIFSDFTEINRSRGLAALQQLMDAGLLVQNVAFDSTAEDRLRAVLPGAGAPDIDFDHAALAENLSIKGDKPVAIAEASGRTAGNLVSTTSWERLLARPAVAAASTSMDLPFLVQTVQIHPATFPLIAAVLIAIGGYCFVWRDSSARTGSDSSAHISVDA